MLDLETSLSYCTYCPKLCRQACPVALVEGRETVTPQTLMASLRLLKMGQVDDAARTAQELFSCTGCLACTTACLHRVTPGKHLIEARGELQSRGLGHPALAEFPAAHRADALKKSRGARDHVPASRVRRAAQVAYFPGCEEPAAAGRALALFDRLGAEHVEVADVTLGCAGYSLWAGGFYEEFKAYAHELAAELQGYGQIIVACPSCAWLLRTVYPEHGVELAPKVLHVIEFLDQLTECLPVHRQLDAAFYHDPCYLGRYLGIYDPPRRLLAQAVRQVHEFSRCREESECCGGGGVFPLTAPATSSAIAEHRLQEVREAGVKLIVTSCPTCQKQLTKDGIVARDLIDVLEEVTRP